MCLHPMVTQYKSCLIYLIKYLKPYILHLIKIYDKKNEILKQLRELKPSESYRHCSPNIQEMFSKSDERYKKSDIRSETEQKELNQLREQQHE